MSVCTGAYLLAETGLLAGKSATTHHGAYVDLARKFPDIHVKRGARFVEDGNLASSGGLSCGIDLAFRVVERYFGREVAKQAAMAAEKVVIKEVLEQVRWNRAEAARLLKISYKAMLYKIRAAGLDDKPNGK